MGRDPRGRLRKTSRSRGGWREPIFDSGLKRSVSETPHYNMVLLETSPVIVAVTSVATGALARSHKVAWAEFRRPAFTHYSRDRSILLAQLHTTL
jgi:hypothetical protein